MNRPRAHEGGNTAGTAVLVTGSSGFIGSAVVERLAARYRVFGLDQPGGARPPPHAECIDADLSKGDSVRSALDEVRQRLSGGASDVSAGAKPRLASVIHLAAYYDFSGEPSPLYEQVTVRGTERLLRGLQAFAVEQLVFSSTMLVHAPCEPGQRIDEEWPLQPKWDYPQSKVDTERLIHQQRGEIPAVLLRIAGVYDDSCHSIPIAHQIERIYERRMVSRVYPGDTSRGQAFVHLDDLVDAFERVVERRSSLPPELPVLIGEPETLSYEELQNELGRLIHDHEWETTRIPKAIAKTGAWVQSVAHEKLGIGEEPFIKPWMIDLADDHYALDIGRAHSLLGWEPRRTLRATLPKMVAALRADPLGWYRENKLEANGGADDESPAAKDGADDGPRAKAA